MDIRELDALKHLQHYCFQLYQFRADQISTWPYDGTNGPTQEEVQTMVEAYYSNVSKSERETNLIFNQKRLYKTFSPDFLLEISNRIKYFVEYHETRLNEVNEITPDANIIGPSVVFAYEKHLQEVQDREQARVARAAGQKVKVPKVGSLYDHIATEEAVAHDRVAQAGFSQSITIEREEVADKVENIVRSVLDDPTILGTLPEDQRKTIAKEIGTSLTTNQEIADKETYLQQQIASEETALSLEEKRKTLPEQEQRKLDLSTETETNIPIPLLSAQAILRTEVKLQQLAQADQIPADKVASITAKIKEKRADFEPLLPKATRLQALQTIASHPEISRLYYSQSFKDSLSQVDQLARQLIPDFNLPDSPEHNFFTVILYSRLREKVLNNPSLNPVNLNPFEFRQQLIKEIGLLVEEHPFFKEIPIYEVAKTNAPQVLQQNPDIVAGLKSYSQSAWLNWGSPSRPRDPTSERRLQQTRDEGERRINKTIVNAYHLRTFFGELNRFQQANILVNGPKGAVILLKYAKAPPNINLKEYFKDDFSQLNKVLKNTNFDHFDPLQKATAIKMADFLAKHKHLSRLLVIPAFFARSPGGMTGLQILVNDPSYLLYIPKYFFDYWKYFYKVEVIEALASGSLAFRIPIFKKKVGGIKQDRYIRFDFLELIHKNSGSLEKLIQAAQSQGKNPFFLIARLKLNRAFIRSWRFAWATDYMGFSTFLLADPKKWLKVRIQTRIRNRVIDSMKEGVIKKAGEWIRMKTYNVFIKIFGKKLAEQVFKKVTAKLIGKVIGLALCTILGLGTLGFGWIGAVIFVYSILRDIVPFLKEIEGFILGSLALLLTSLVGWIGQLFGAIGGLLGSAIGTLSSLLTGLTSGVATGIGGGAAGVGIAALGGVAGFTMLSALATNSSFVDYQKNAAPIYYSSCGVKDIHNLGSITPENKAIFVSKFKALFPNSLLESKIDEVIFEAKKVGFNPALAVAIWGEESHFSNYGSAGGEENVAEGYDFGCGVYCTDTKPKNYAESLACFVGKNGACSDSCLNKTNFKEFMECYGPASENPYFISNTISIFKELVTDPNAIECSGGTTGQFASQLINHLLSCYNHGGVINDTSFTDGGQCLRGQGVPASSVSFVAGSVQSYHSLQCVGFAMAVEAGTGAGNGFTRGGYGNAKEYYRETPGYQVIPKSAQNVVVGDLAFFDGPYGHVAVVVDTAPDMSWFRVAQAVGMNKDGSWSGLVNESGRQPISSEILLGFLRRK